tara:strand:- start:1124 stop:1858 length:735 start_codon:yes stop_codon:yes gene_type:complete
MRLIWTYSKDYKKGNKNNRVPHEYIQFLFRKAISTAPDSYEKIVYTEEENFSIFSDLGVSFIPLKKKPFTFLADLKFDIADQLSGEFLISDGDLFIEKELEFKVKPKIGFEVKVQKDHPIVLEYKQILIDQGITKIQPFWNIENNSSINLGLMYFNDDKIKDDYIKEFRKVQTFYNNYIEPKYKFNEKGLQFSACGSQMFSMQYFLNKGIKPHYFIPGANITHLAAERKDKLLSEFYKNNETLI